MTAVTAHQMTFLDALDAHAPKRLAVSAASFADDGLPPPTHAQVYYWRELAGAITLQGAAGMADDAWPDDLNPPRQTLKQLEERQLVVRRGRAWHLRRHWYSRLQALRQRAVERPTLSPAERPAPDLPTYVELKAFEALCLYLGATPKCCARLPFVGWSARMESVGDIAGIEGDVPVTLLKLMRHFKLRVGTVPDMARPLAVVVARREYGASRVRPTTTRPMFPAVAGGRYRHLASELACR